MLGGRLLDERGARIKRAHTWQVETAGYAVTSPMSTHYETASVTVSSGPTGRLVVAEEMVGCPGGGLYGVPFWRPLSLSGVHVILSETPEDTEQDSLATIGDDLGDQTAEEEPCKPVLLDDHLERRHVADGNS